MRLEDVNKSSNVKPSEKALIAKARQGDQAAYGQLVTMYSKKVMTTIYYRVGNRDDAEDLAQEVFLKAYRGLQRFKGDASFSTWLYRIAHNVSASHFAFKKAKKRDGPLVSIHQDNMPELEAPTQRGSRPEARMLSAEMQEAIDNAIQSLPPDMRELVVLKDIEDKPYDEISRIVDLPIGTVKSRIHRSRVQLRDKLKRYL